MYHEGPKLFSYSNLIMSKYYRNDYELNTCGLYFLSSKGTLLYLYKTVSFIVLYTFTIITSKHNDDKSFQSVFCS